MHNSRINLWIQISHTIYSLKTLLSSFCIRYYNYVKNIDTYFAHIQKVRCVIKNKTHKKRNSLTILNGERGALFLYNAPDTSYILQLINNAMIGEVWKRISKYIISRSL